MTVRTDITMNWEVSPRIATIAAPSVELTIQDNHDTLASFEDSIVGHQHDNLISSAGKEDLGGSVSVGITSTLQNVQDQFEGRTTATESGAVSSNDTTGTLLHASGGLFVTNGVSSGDTVFNSTTGSMATILSVTDENNLVSQQITGGARTTWLNTDNYSIYENVQCTITGGNLVAVDDVDAAISPVLQSPNTNVIRTSSSSATIQNQTQLESATFIGKEGLGISVSPLTGTDSIVYPVGTRASPCKTELNVTDIDAERGFNNVYVLDNLTLTDNHSSHPHVFFGDNPQLVNVHCDVTSDVTGCKFQDLYVTGQLKAANIVWECIVGSITNANGFIYKSTIIGPIVVSDNTSINKCWVAPTAVDQEVIIDFNSLTKTVLISQWEQGKIIVKNMVTGSILHMAGSGGALIIDSTVVGGDITYGGAIKLASNSGTPDLVTDATTSGQVNDSTKIVELWQEKGLDTANPLTVSKTNRSFGSVSQTISGTDTVTVQRD